MVGNHTIPTRRDEDVFSSRIFFIISNMNKLQLYITKSYGGYKVLFNINPSEEVTRHVRELRQEVRKVKYDSTEKNIFFYVSTISSGTFLTIIRTIPSAPVDHLAAWIYIPNELVIDAETLESIVNITMRKISGERVTQEDVARLRELFATEYMTEAEVPLLTASNSSAQIGWRSYNGNTGVTLRDLLGKGLFQVPYLDYNGVFFVDKDLEITVQGADLTGTPIMGPAVIMPTEKSPENFVAHVFGHPADKPIRATIDTNIPVVWKQAGFDDVVKEEVVTSPEFHLSMPDTSRSTKEISPASFQIAAQSGTTQLKDCKITVNGFEVSEKPHRFTTAELTSAQVVVNCEGYAPFSGRKNLAMSTRTLIRLQERTKVYNFEMPVKSADLGAPVRFKIFSKKPISGSPLEGYVTSESEVLEGETRVNHLVYVPSPIPLNNKLVYIGAGLLIGLIFGWITACGGGSSKETSKEETEQTEVAETTPETTTTDGLDSLTLAKLNSLFDYQQKKTEYITVGSQNKEKEKAEEAEPQQDMSKVSKESISYLDKNKTWRKDELEKQPGLSGLYDDLNNFNLDRITTEWADKLSDSKSFRDLVKYAKNGQNPKKRDKCLAKGSTFNDSSSSEINLQQYKFRIDP